MLLGRLVAFTLAMLWMSAVAQGQGWFQCQPGQRQVLYGGGIRCQCPDGTWANYLSPCPNSQQPLPSIDFDSTPSTPRESMLQAARQRIWDFVKAFRQDLSGTAPLSSSIPNQSTIAPPKGYSAAFEQQPKTAPSAQPNAVLFSNTPIARTSPATLPASPSKLPAGKAVTCGAGQRPSAQGAFCELDPNQAPQNRPTQSTPRPTGSYAACVALSSNTGAFASNSTPPSCVMADGYTYYKDGRAPTR